MQCLNSLIIATFVHYRLTQVEAEARKEPVDRPGMLTAPRNLIIAVIVNLVLASAEFRESV